MIRLGVTGTDTGVGKTVSTCALVSALRRRGLRVVPMKPIETGVVATATDRDAAQLARAAGVVDVTTVGPITLPDPVAPLVAARRAGATIDLDALDRAVDSMAADADALIVEGAGGLLVPITETIAFDALFRRWSLDLLIVAANRLGVLNHVLLTVKAANHASIRVAGIVLNQVTAAPVDPSARDNAAILRELVGEIPVVELPWIPYPTDLDSLADAAEQSGLAGLVAAHHTIAVPD